MTHPHPMEGRGFYNQHSRGQHDADRVALPALEAAARRAPLPPDGVPFTIADYASSQGRNSLEPMALAIKTVRERDPARSVAVYHTDLPGNDFTSLFELLETSPRTYRAPGVFAYAVGHSFYRPLFPPRTVCLGWCAIATHWLSRAPCAVPGHVFPPRGPESVQQAFRRQAAEDWRTFLELRRDELRPGAQLVMVNTVADEGWVSGPEAVLDEVARACQSLEEEGHLRPEERAAMVIACWFRTEEEYRAPFADLDGLELESFEARPLPWSMWNDFRKSGDAARLATAGWARGWTGPGLAAGLDPSRPREERRALMDELWTRVRAAIERDPSLADCRWTTCVAVMTRTARA